MDRKQAIECLKRLENYEDIVHYLKDYSVTVQDSLHMAIDSLKTDEAYQLEYENRDCVEVVRCKDCKYWHRKSLPWSGMHGCDTMNAYTSADGYCFKAERIKEQTDV